MSVSEIFSYKLYWDSTCAARGNSPLYETSDFAVFPILRFFKTGNGTAGRTIQVDGIACIEVRPLVPKGIFP